MSSTHQVSPNLLELSFNCSASELEQLCRHAYGNDPNNVLTVMISKKWRDGPDQPVRLLEVADECKCQLIPIGQIPLDGSGQHFMVIADVYCTDSLQHGPLILDMTTRKYHEAPNITNETRLTAILDTGSGLGYIQDYSTFDGAYPPIELAVSDCIAFCTEPARPYLCLDKVDETKLLSNSGADPNEDGSGEEGEDA